MPAYAFEALTADGDTRKGVIEADSARSARGLLRAQALVPLVDKAEKNAKVVLAQEQVLTALSQNIQLAAIIQPSSEKKLDKIRKLVDIQANVAAGKGIGYERWAKKFNLKRWSQTLCLLQEKKLLSEDALHQRIAELQTQHDDALAAVAARLLLFTDPKKLPELSDAAGAWNLYVRTWRPGKPHRKTWDAFHAEAVKTVFEWADS